MSDFNRVTIMLDKNLERTLRNLQSKLIKDTQKNVSFSKVINESLKKHFKIK